MAAVSAALTVVHLAPHPDDELLGAPATLLRLRDAGHRIVNVACSLGRPEQRERRRAEVAEACARAGFELVVLDSLDRLADLVRAADLVLAPTPHDGHPCHELVGRAARDALATERAPRLWLWGLWADLPLPTLFVPFAEAELARAAHALGAHAGELARNDYVELLRARAVAARVLGAERVFGFGAARRQAAYAELLTEVQYADGEWWAGAAREPDPAAPLAPVPRERPLGWWLRAPAFGERLAARSYACDVDAVSEVVARNLRGLRTDRGLSVSDLARRSGVAKGTISRLEAGNATNPTVETLWALSDALGTSLADLIVADTAAPRVVRTADAEWIDGDVLRARVIDRLAGREVHDVSEVHFEAGRARDAGPHARGSLAHVFVTHGRLAVGPPGEEVELDAGDYAAVAADRPHRYEGRAPRTEALVLISLPRSPGPEGYVSTLTR